MGIGGFGEDRRISAPFADGNQELFEIFELMPCEDGREPLPDEVFLSRLQDQAALLVQHASEEFERRGRDEQLSHGLASRVE